MRFFPQHFTYGSGRTRGLAGRATRLLLLLALTLCGAARAAAAAGDIDPTFNPVLGVTRIALVNALAVQPDGKLLVGGTFNVIGGVPHVGVFRVNTDGTPDASFYLPGAKLRGSVNAIALQPDGKVLVGGLFIEPGGTLRGVVRLNADGSLDAAFLSRVPGINGTVTDLAVRPDGRVVIVGGFTMAGGVVRGSAARLNSDGSLDTSFAAPELNGVVHALVLQPDGKVIVGGAFTAVGATPRGRLARLNADGSLDASFLSAGSGAEADVFALALQPDGKVIVGGGFTFFNDAQRGRLVRLHPDGTPDSSFNVAAGPDASVESVALQPDGKILVGGFFHSFGGATRTFLARVNADGTLDTGYQSSGAGTSNAVSAIAAMPGGGAYIGGVFQFVNQSPQRFVARLDNAGNTDTSFFLFVSLRAAGSVEALALQPNGAILTGGSFSDVNGTTHLHLARLDSNGADEFPFNRSSAPLQSGVKAIAVRPDGKILLGGLSPVSGDTTRRCIALLNADGTLDTSFPNSGSSNMGPNGDVWGLVLQPDGRIVIGGRFTTVNGQPRPKVARLNADGSLDTSFAAVDYLGNFNVSAVAVQPDGKVLVGGNFPTPSGGRPAPGSGVMRINANGTIDTTFYTSIKGPDLLLSKIVTQPDGRVLVAGRFDSVNDTPRNGLARLNADGSLDASFHSDAPAGAIVLALALQTNGRVLVGGSFSTFGGVRRGNLARLKADGSLDETFLNFVHGANGPVRAIAVQPDGRVLIGGDFSLVNNEPYSGIARLNVGLSPNPLDTSANFVTQHYRDFLNREPDAEGLQFWTSDIEGCGANAACREVKRINVSAAFFLSIEFQQTGYLVYLAHQASFNTGPTLRRDQFLADMRAIGAGVVVGADGWEQQLEANKRAYFDALVARQAFLDRYPQAMPAAQFIEALNAHTLDPNDSTAGGSLTAPERDALAAALAAGTLTRAQVLRAFAEHAVFSRREFNRAFVLMQYFGYLRRNPDGAPDADFNGYNFWLAKLNEFRGNFVEAEMVKAFLSADEYRGRFGTP